MMDNLIPVGMSSLAAALRNSNIDIELFDTTFYRTKELSGDEMRVRNFQIPPFQYSDYGVSYKKNNMEDDFADIIKSFKPNLIAFSVVEPTYELALRLLDSIRGKKIPVVMGGIHAIFDYENIIRDARVDMVCLGESETYFPVLCNKIKNGEDYWNTPNFWVKKDGEIFKNKLGQLENIDNLPMLECEIYEKERFYRPMAGKIYKMMPVEFSRGCPFNCTYCADFMLAERFKEQGKWLRFKSIDRIIKEINFYISNYNINYFYFVSETFLAMPKQQLNEFIERYSDIKVPFWFNTRPETVTAALMNKLKEVGCHRVSIGIEHGNEEFRRKMLKRNVSNSIVIKAINIMNDSGLSYSVNNIIGFPEETRELIFDTIELNRIVSSNSIGCYIFSPYRGTVLRQYCVEKGYIDKDFMTPDLNFESILNMPTIKKEEIVGLARTFAMYVKFPKDRWPEIRLAESNTAEGNKAFEKLGKEFLNKYF